MSEQKKQSSDETIGKDKPKPLRLAMLFKVSRLCLYAAVLFVFIYIFTPLGSIFYNSLLTEDELEKSDYIVVLGGGFERVAEAANLHRQGWAPKIILTSTPADIRDMVELAENYGVSPADIITDSHSTRTARHPITISQLDGIDKDSTRLILITSAQHTSRARACFDKAGYKRIIMRYPMFQHIKSTNPNWQTRARHLSSIAYEYAAWVLYKIRGWV